MGYFGLHGGQIKLKLSGKGQSKLKLSGNGNECKPLPDMSSSSRASPRSIGKGEPENRDGRILLATSLTRI